MTTDESPEDRPSPRPPRRRSSIPPSHLADLERQETGYRETLKYDVPAALVVFLVALPLCLGIAVASGAPPLAGLVTGIVGGLVVAWASGSALAVSGPAAGLTTIVLVAIDSLGYEGFLLTVVIAGGMQIVFGVARAGVFAYYFPSSVIKGMLAAIGLILIIKQIPHALGYDADFEGDLTLLRSGQLGPVESIRYAFGQLHPGAAITAALGLLALVAWNQIEALKKLKWLPAPLVVVLLGVGLNALYASVMPSFVMEDEHLVSLPARTELLTQLRMPSFERFLEPEMWQTGFVIAVVASIETLLCIEAIDKLDPYKRITNTNRELVAQGVGNIVSGLIGGLPLTAVIVRGSANIQSGGRTRMSAFLHGALLLLAVVLLPFAMNLIPLAALAAVLLHVGYKLARVGVFRHMLRQSPEQWMPFLVTVIAILATDLLRGVGIGMAVGVFFVLRANLKVPYFIHHRESHAEGQRSHIKIELSENVSFLNKASVNKVLHEMPADSLVEIDGSTSQYIHPDVLELVHEFADTAHTRGIEVVMVDIPEAAPTMDH